MTDFNNGRAYYVVTYYDRAQVGDAEALSAIPISFGKRGGRPVLLGAYSSIDRSHGTVSVERNHMSRVARVLMQTERNRDIGSWLQRELEEISCTLMRGPAIFCPVRRQIRLDARHVPPEAQVSALGLAVMVVFMILASQFKSLRLPFVILFTVPATLVGIVLALLAAGQGLSITALMLNALMHIGIAALRPHSPSSPKPIAGSLRVKRSSMR